MGIGYKIFAGVVAMVLAIGFLAPPLIKLKDFALGAVILIGIAMMLVDLWQSIESKDD